MTMKCNVVFRIFIFILVVLLGMIGIIKLMEFSDLYIFLLIPFGILLTFLYAWMWGI